MKFKFDANQDYQINAVDAVAELFTGQRRVEADLSFSEAGMSFAAVPNRLDLYEEELLGNLHAVQRRTLRGAQQAGQEHVDGRLETIDEEIVTAGGQRAGRFFNFSVEMETGTGKTYVYVRTMLELFRRYGMRKFIVVVPSVAIREGVLKTLDMTRSHFQKLYENPPVRSYIYSSDNLAQVRQFALSDGVEIMIMTLASFNKAGNVIHQSTDRLQGETPVHLVQTARPILILDEPQNMESEKSIAALAVLNPLFALRYSATHRNPYNVVYRLTPYEAYQRGLVKKIEVASVVREDATAQPYVRLVSVDSKKQTLTARMVVHKLMKTGDVRESRVTVGPGKSLVDKTDRSEYQGYEIEEINIVRQTVRFANGMRVRVGEELGADKDAVFEAQIRTAIVEHFEKQEDCRHVGVKVLSLFFIDRVDNYAQEDGLIRTLFNRIYEEEKGRYPQWKERAAEDVQAAYFAQRRTRAGDVILEDSSSGESQKDQDTYDLIMKDKERLLSFAEPVSFIFSHSALREGWDNPNIFQICTLNQSVSDMRKRQEVGRGVRLAVNQQGDRIWDERVNILTVVANESYDKFVTQLQSEIAYEFQAEIEKRYGMPLDALSDAERRKIEEEYGTGILPPKPANRRQREKATLRKELAYDQTGEFWKLWERIRAKTRYSVVIDSEKLITDVVTTMRGTQIRPPQVTVTKAVMNVNVTGAFEALQMSAAKTLVSLVGRYPLPNLLEVMSELMAFTSPPMRVTKRTMLEILKRLSPELKQSMVENPNDFAKVMVGKIKERLAEQLVSGIRYEPTGEWWDMSQLFDEELDGYLDRMVAAPKSVYSHVLYDSNVEQDFVKMLEGRTDVEVYVKLPRAFKVETPIGNYNPDWAIVVKETDQTGRVTGRKCYLVRETKGTTDHERLQYIHERQKVEWGEQHFKALGVSYEVVDASGDLRLPAECGDGGRPLLGV